MCLYAEVFPKLDEYILATEIDEKTQNLIKWRTLKNLRCKGKIPDDCFIRLSPRKILVVRDKLFHWLSENARN